MSKKISILRVAQSYKSIKQILKSNTFKKLSFQTKEIRTNSSDSFSNSNSRVLEHILIIVILTTYCYYILENDSDMLLNRHKNELEYIRKLNIQELNKYEPTKIEKELTLSIFKKSSLDLDKKSYFDSSRRFAQKDSQSLEHKNAFNKDKYSTKNNFVLKIRGSGTEKTYIRIGIIISDEKDIIEIKNVVNKDNQN